MEVIVATHPSALLHDTGPRHPERPVRVQSVLAGIEASGLDMQTIESPAIDLADLARVHDPGYIDAFRAFCERGGGALDMDTLASQSTWQAAITAVGGVMALIDELEGRTDATGFAVTRPPGHHALAARAMGFCFFNNVAVATASLRSRGDRVAVLDWDVHHGNGTQAMLADDPGALYVSVHQDHFYPFEGAVGDIDVGDAKGTVINVPLPAGTGGDVYREAWASVVIPVVTQFAPDWVLVSAGFDAHARDDLADLRLTNTDYGWMASELARIHPVNRTLFALEGGYDLEALRSSTRSTLLGMAGHEFEGPDNQSPPYAGGALVEARDAVARYWAL
jgi:acetoin utilization deacetylase AcuC-like enzyme